jgi:replicative DNA helicase
MATTPQLYAAEAEEGVLASCLIGGLPTVLTAQLTLPDPGAFFLERHRALYATYLALAERNATIDHISLRDELQRRAALEVVGGLGYLGELVDAVPTAVNVTYYARIVRDFAVRRALVARGHETVTLAQDLRQSVTDTVPALVEGIVQAMQPAGMATPLTPRAEFNRLLLSLEERARSGDEIPGIPSGIDDLDALTDGWMPGRLTVVAARPSLGKTSFGIHCGERAAALDRGVYFATAEEPVREVCKRRLAAATGVNLRMLKQMEQLDRVSARLSRASAGLADRPFHVDAESLTPAAIRMGVQRKQAEWGQVGLVVIDYLGLYTSGKRADNRDTEIGKMTRAFALMARALDVPVLLLVQLNRDSVRGDKPRRPTLSDLRDSGNIEQDARQVVFLYSEADRNEAWPAPKVELIVAKNNYGPVGRAYAHIDRETGRWRSWKTPESAAVEPSMRAHA